ncbi:ATP-binding response regulator [Desulfospira joergensenii]|uniref:ATP-binding response regulator n=1 Tax=Desulfospira joergensenii TaxID=53329 RepID=UPI0003B43F89|nr:response regulator [Desulfospira joergensenii]
MGNSPAKVLVIDDEPAIRESFCDFLTDRDYHVITAENGRIGLELLEQEHPDMVLVDLRMPELDGLEVLKRGREIAPDIPKVVISGGNRIGDVVQALRYGAWDYLVKPVKDLSILDHIVEKALEKARLLNENLAYQRQLEEMVRERTLELEKAFEALQKSDKQYRTLFEKTNDAIFIEEIGSGRYQDANQAAAQLTGRSLEELKNLTSGDIISDHPDRRAFILGQSDRLERLGAVVFHRPDDSFRVARISTVPLDEKNIIRIARDITHDLEVEIQLRQSQKMEALGTLAGGIAHDFNNILSGIFGYADLLRMNLEDPGAAGQNLDQIIKGAHRATDLVHQILTFSRQAEQKKVPLKISAIVKEALKFLRSSIPSTIIIKENIFSGAMVIADPTQIHQVVMNLCTNAYHTMIESGGTLTVTLTETRISEPIPTAGTTISPGEYVCFEVKDTGQGMEPEILDKIFDPYFTTKKPDKGTGLGLAVVTGIVEKHKGSITVESIPGLGSTFRVYFPAAEQTRDRQTEDIPAEAPRGMSKTILLVDDEPDILNPFSRFLEKFGYEVHAFTDGLEALEAFYKDPERFDLIITDMFMPGMTGEALSTKILEINKEIPIILCTGYSDRFNEAQAMSLGIRKYVQKPIMSRELNNMICEIFRNEIKG